MLISVEFILRNAHNDLKVVPGERSSQGWRVCRGQRPSAACCRQGARWRRCRQASAGAARGLVRAPPPPAATIAGGCISPSAAVPSMGLDGVSTSETHYLNPSVTKLRFRLNCSFHFLFSLVETDLQISCRRSWRRILDFLGAVWSFGPWTFSPICLCTLSDNN